MNNSIKKKQKLIPGVNYQLDFGYTAEKLLTYNRLIENNSRGVRMIISGRLEQAEEFYKNMLGNFYRQQTLSKERFHKGVPYNNLAVVFAIKGEFNTAAENFVLAFIEDLLTFGEAANGYMAARVLRLIGIPSDFVERLATESLARRQSPPDAPEHLFKNFEKEVANFHLSKIPDDMLTSVISTETSQGLSTVVELQTSEIFTQMKRDRFFAVWGFVIGIVSLGLSLFSIIIDLR